MTEQPKFQNKETRVEKKEGSAMEQITEMAQQEEKILGTENAETNERRESFKKATSWATAAVFVGLTFGGFGGVKKAEAFSGFVGFGEKPETTRQLTQEEIRGARDRSSAMFGEFEQELEQFENRKVQKRAQQGQKELTEEREVKVAPVQIQEKQQAPQKTEQHTEAESTEHEQKKLIENALSAIYLEIEGLNAQIALQKEQIEKQDLMPSSFLGRSVTVSERLRNNLEHVAQVGDGVHLKKVDVKNNKVTFLFEGEIAPFFVVVENGKVAWSTMQGGSPYEEHGKFGFLERLNQETQ